MVLFKTYSNSSLEQDMAWEQGLKLKMAGQFKSKVHIWNLTTYTLKKNNNYKKSWTNKQSCCLYALNGFLNVRWVTTADNDMFQ